MTRNKILNGITITAISAILLAWAPSTAYGGFVEGGILDIKPGSCPNPVNLGSNGVIPVAILGSDTLDVNDIDLSSFPETWRPSFEDVATPFVGEFIDRDSCTEAGPDGLLDLTLKIPASAFLILCVLDDQNVALIGTDFTLLDGTAFLEFDVVSILKKNNNNRA